MAHKQTTSPVDVFEGALDDILARLFVSAENAEETHRQDTAAVAQCRSIAVAYSGGLDSSALLHMAHAYAARRSIQLFAFHVHHGISRNADHWLAHCHTQCIDLGIAFDARRIELASKDSGVEEAARVGRYAALGEMCRQHGVPLLLTAHHQDDQAETVLLQLLRGSGVAGLSGMDAFNAATDLLGAALPVMARPLLPVSRTDLEDFVARKAAPFIEDESNSDPRYARNALRSQVMPALGQFFPGFQERFSRSAQHAQSAQRLLIELAAQDLEICRDGDCLNLAQLEKLSADRLYNLLRYWFGTRHLRMPSTAWLAQLRIQMFDAKEDAQICVTHPDCHVRRHRGRLFITPRLSGDSCDIAPVPFRWNGEASMAFADFGGSLHFEQAEQGFDPAWLQQQALQMRYRQGGERLKPAANRPTKSLKYHYQACDVPAWERERLPLVWNAERLLYAAGIGLDCFHLSNEPAPKITLHWQADIATAGKP